MKEYFSASLPKQKKLMFVCSSTHSKHFYLSCLNLKSLSNNIATIPEISHAGAILLFICVYISSHQVVHFLFLLF